MQNGIHGGGEMCRWVMMIGVAVVFAATCPAADVPGLIDYQGRLTDTNDVPIHGSVSLTFAIYSQVSSGSALWTETHDSVNVADGLFHVLLGSVTAFPLDLFDGSDRWLGVAVASDPEMSPRCRIASVAYALRAGGGSGGSLWTEAGGNVYRTSGRVGIGTPSPETALHVEGTLTVDQKIQADDSGGLEFALHDGTTIMKLDPNNGVGIGADPAYLFHVKNPYDDCEVRFESDAGAATLTLDGTSAGAGIFFAESGAAGAAIGFDPATDDILMQADGIFLEAVDIELKGDVFAHNRLKVKQKIIAADGGGLSFESYDGTVLVKMADGGDVGIGTAKPDCKLDVEGEIEVNAVIRANNTAGLSLETQDGTSRLRVLNDGRVGIGGVPVNDLDVYRSGQPCDVKVDSDGGSASLTVEGSVNADIKASGAASASMTIDGGSGLSQLIFTQSGAYRCALGYSNTEGHMFLCNNGNVAVKNGSLGVGTIDPSERLHVIGRARIEDASTNASMVVKQGGAGDFLYCRSTYLGPDQDVIRLLGDGTVECKVLSITGGSDLAEPFDVVQEGTLESGTVVAIDARNPGKLRVCETAYDRCVAGIISGAGGINPGVTLRQEGSAADSGRPVALTGRAYCRADATEHPIVAGDLLTSSDTPGHAMKVTDFERANGAILGKAMSSLSEGRGLVLVLVALQ